MIEEKLEVMKKELTAVSAKEKELHDALLQTQELKLKYLGAIEVLEQLKEEEPKKDKKVDDSK
jgi:hypothetical protein